MLRNLRCVGFRFYDSCDTSIYHHLLRSVMIQCSLTVTFASKELCIAVFCRQLAQEAVMLVRYSAVKNQKTSFQLRDRKKEVNSTKFLIQASYM